LVCPGAGLGITAGGVASSIQRAKQWMMISRPRGRTPPIPFMSVQPGVRGMKHTINAIKTSHQRCAWRRDEFRAYGPDRDEPARSRGDVRYGDGGDRRVPPSHGGDQRRWPNSGRGVDLIDMNREWRGSENGATAPSGHAGLLFNCQTVLETIKKRTAN
jgi:hypothetical protein